jgi:metal-dependent hydrolase (beta-lactamase superfamily II)
MRRFAVDPNDIDLSLLAHLHGDHFGGMPRRLVDWLRIAHAETNTAGARSPTEV